MAWRGVENISAFTLPRVFKKNSGAENLLLRVHERYSDLSGAEECSRGGELR